MISVAAFLQALSVLAQKSQSAFKRMWKVSEESMSVRFTKAMKILHFRFHHPVMERDHEVVAII
jgi:hypothetical protein